MSRVKNFDATGIAPNGVLYAGDLNAIQDHYADLVNLAQTFGVGVIQVGESGLQIIRFGAGEARITGALRTDGILRGLGGLYGGQFTTTQRDAIAAGSRPTGLTIFNTTTGRYETNSGTDASPSWTGIAQGITNADIAAGAAIAKSKLAALGIVDADIAAGAAIAKAKLASLAITDADVAAGAAIVRSKLNFGSGLVDADIAAAAAIAKTKLAALNIVNADVAAGAGIVYSKLNVSASIVNADIAPGALIDGNKLNWHVGTAPPGSPLDGMIWIYNGSGFNWMFVYDSTEATYKWKFIGGGALSAETVGQATTTNLTYTSVGPLVVAPRAGDYEITFGGDGQHDGGWYGYLAPVIGGGTGASDNDSVVANYYSTGTESIGATRSRKIIRNVANPSANIDLQIKAGGGTTRWSKRTLSVKPLRVI